jgi:hypothetical protein
MPRKAADTTTLPTPTIEGKIELGDRIRDRVSGIEGIATARTEWLFGCVRFILQPQGEKKDWGTPHEGFSVDEPQLELVEKAVVAPPKKVEPVERSYGPRADHQVTRR